MTDTPDWAETGIAAVTVKTQTRPGSPSRFPFTYAYDYIRANPAEFNLTPGISRVEVAEHLHRIYPVEDTRHAAILRLALAYVHAEQLTFTPEYATVAATWGADLPTH